MSYDLLSLGETMLALAPISGTSIRAADSLLVDHAGAESNTAVGLARLGLRAAWISCLGDDAAGSSILDAIAAEGVDIRWVRRDPLRPTGLMLKDPERGVRYYRTGSAASAMGPDILDGVPVADARAVLVTGVTALIGAGPQAAGLALLGPREIVVRGADSIGVLADGSWTHLDIRRDAAVDPIGAGDAFNAGYIAVRLRGGSMDEALRTGIRCGTAVTTSVSDTAAFPRQLER